MQRVVRKKKYSLGAWAVLLLLAISVLLPAETGIAQQSSQKVFVKVKYVRADNNYEGWDVWTWSNISEGRGVPFTGQDQEGRYAIIETTKDADLGLIIRKYDWSDKFVPDDIKPDFSNGNVEYLATVDTEGNRELTTREPAKAFDDVTLQVHYYRFDGNYTDWDIWTWAPEGVGTALEKEDDYGKLATVPIGAVGENTEIGLIVRKTDWSEKDWEADRFVDKFFINGDGQADLYIVQGQEEIYYDEMSAKKVIEDLKNPRITAAKIDTLTKIVFETNSKLALDGIDIKVREQETKKEIPVKNVELAENGLSGSIDLTENLDLNAAYLLEINNLPSKELTLGKIFDSQEFADLYTYTGELGAVYSPSGTTFSLWSPTASSVSVVLYGTDGTQYTSPAEQVIEMKRGENGSWQATVSGDLNGIYYNYLVSIGETKNEVVDPYAKAVGVNGTRGMVIDLASTDPEGWKDDSKPELTDATDAIIYEMHIRDFSISEKSGVTFEYKGKYQGVWQSGTTIPGTDVKTGVDHLKELGVNVVHILPTFDHQSIDETKLDTPQYNWGYDPKNYNVPEGSYSSDPYTGKIRIEEFKKMVMELHQAGIRVVMDVVYNHTGATLDSNLNLAVPNYYYRQNAQGGFSNGSACGNETASERSMVGRLIGDSVIYWAEEYHIDGFRFDLMAIHDINTMKTIRTRLDAIDPTILMYGEGWTGGESPLAEDQKASKANTIQYGEMQIAAFSDDIRDGIKGSVFDEEGKAFINGADGYEETIKFGIVASTPNDQIDTTKVKNETQPWANEPYQTITYASAHDNLTLWDKLQKTNPLDSEETRMKRNKMSAAIVYTSQGIPFIQAGEEMARTKENPDGSLNENSYNAPDSVNQIDWTRKITYHDLYQYYKGLIEMRKSHRAFRMNHTEDIQKNLNFLNIQQKNVAAYTLNGEAAGDNWKTIAVTFNAGTEDIQVKLPSDEWVVVVDENNAGIDAIKEINGDTVTIPAQSSYVLVDKNSFYGIDQPESEKPSISDVKAIDVTSHGYTVTANISAPVGLHNVLCATWTTANGQDDIIWESVPVENGKICYQVSADAHNQEYGSYNTHIYVHDKNGNFALQGIEVEVLEGTPVLNSSGHVQNIGWQDWNSDRAVIGTTGKMLRLEAIKLRMDTELEGSIQYRVHVQNIGWQDWKETGEQAGTTGQNLRIEAIQIRLTGELARKYEIQYRAHIQNIGWTDWTGAEELAGTTGKSLRMEAVEIRLIPSWR